MSTRLTLILVLICTMTLSACSVSESRSAAKAPAEAQSSNTDPNKLILTEDEWRVRLTPEEFAVLRQHGTEAAWEGCFVGTVEPGTYTCAACGAALFMSESKFDSDTGWPSFTKPISPAAVTEHEDRSYGMVRTEVRCTRCESHLGHVFPHRSSDTGLRYCINSVCMKHVPPGGEIVLLQKDPVP